MIVLGIDTATACASVGIVSPHREPIECSQAQRGNHAQQLLSLIERARATAGLSLGDLHLIAVSIGPGSFTGLRIGLSVAKGLALAAKIPVVGVPTLDAYAHTVGSVDLTIVPVLDARKGEVYAAGYRWRGAQLEREFGPITVTPTKLIEYLDRPCLLLGDGVDAYEDLWISVPTVVQRLRLSDRPPSGAVVASLGATYPATDHGVLEPRYWRAAEAEVRRHSASSALSTG